MYEKGSRPELAAQEKKELEIITRYLPKQASEEEIKAIIAKIIAESGATGTKDFGKVMPQAMKELKGKADGKMVQQLVKESLGS